MRQAPRAAESATDPRAASASLEHREAVPILADSARNSTHYHRTQGRCFGHHPAMPANRTGESESAESRWTSGLDEVVLRIGSTSRHSYLPRWSVRQCDTED